MSLADRARWVNRSSPQIVADVVMYRTEDGGRRTAALPGWGCPCMVDPAARIGYDCWPILGERQLFPGDRLRLGFVFLTEEGAAAMRSAGRFFLWEGKTIGEAHVLSGEDRGHGSPLTSRS